MAHKLTEIKLNEVSLVPIGANPGAHITLIKAKGIGKMAEEILKQQLTEANAKLETLTKKNANLEAENEKLKKDTESVKKAADEAHAAEIKKREDEITKLKADAEDAALKSEVEKSFPNTPGTVDEKVKTLKALRKMEDKDAAATLEKSMKENEERLAKLAKETGHTGGDGNGAGTASDKLEKMAHDIAKEQKTTYEQGFSKAIDTPEGRKLYVEMRGEQGQKGE